MIFPWRAFDFENDRNLGVKEFFRMVFQIGLDVEYDLIDSTRDFTGKGVASVGVARSTVDIFPPIGFKALKFKSDPGSRESSARVENMSADHKRLYFF
jgi:hypothetical protein